MTFNNYKFFRQPDAMDCGPTCLRMIAAHYKRKINIQDIRESTEINRSGVSMYSLSAAAEKFGFHTRGVMLSVENLRKIPLPSILHWKQNHFVVLYACKKKKFIVADPGSDIITFTENEFLEHWSQGRPEGIALLLNPTPSFYNLKEEKRLKQNLFSFFSYILRYKKLLVQLFLGLFIGSFLQLLLPFLTQSIVDIAIPTQDVNLIFLILIAQFALLVGRTSVNFIRSWILLHISTRLNIFVLTDFLSKLMRLPIQFFDTKKTGDILQRIGDQKRIETFLASQTLDVGFAAINVIIFSVMLIFYQFQVFLVFFIGSAFYTVWILSFLGKRKQLDYKRFDISSQNQSLTIQLIQGMQEIKISGTEKKRRWDWENIQARLFHFNIKSLALGQYQQAGGIFFNEGKNILIIYIVAKSVVSGELTLGSMIAIQYLVGQLNSPVELFLGFIQGYQDAKLSLERLNELFSLEDEEDPNKEYIHQLPTHSEISLRNVYFNYPGNAPVLKNINLNIPRGKTTAIVGMSGSGKSTLIKILLGFYNVKKGGVFVGETNLERISPNFWRLQCGVVLQESFIFSDTIANNIALSQNKMDWDLLDKAIKLACLEDFINSLPMGVNTLIGAEGNGVSQGQSQRILIARAIYKQPELILFDEATNSLDSNNERQIVENLSAFFQGRTVVVVAHRLSTVRHADNIVVLENGEIIEQGAHHELISKKGKYFELVKNQLELGK